MNNFEYYNPVRVIFGKESIAKLGRYIPANQKIMLLYGGGSIKRNGVYDQVTAALGKDKIVEFGGVEANPEYETCLKAMELIKSEGVEFILAVGGGSVIDAAKFIAAGVAYEGDNPWDILTGTKVKAAMPLGAVLTLAATGSEMNGNSVISKRVTTEKRSFASPFVMPKFSILDPETTYTLPERQLVNGVVDSYVHVMEQYMTYPVNSPLQDRQSEAILLTLIEEGPKAVANPDDYGTRANLMWCATQALNGLIGCGVVQDWSTHMIGHEITAFAGLDHAQSLAVVLPQLLRNQKENKAEKLVQYAERIFGITGGDQDQVIEEAIEKTVDFFQSLGMKTTLSEYGIKLDQVSDIPAVFEKRGFKLGERQEISPDEVALILQGCK